MTLRELVEDAIGLESPLPCLVCAFQVVRSIVQRETATWEGCCASLEAWLDIYQEVTPTNVSRWLEDLGRLADLDLPDALVLQALDEAD